MRQQFSREINVRISQFAADFVKNFRERLGNDPRVPELPFKRATSVIDRRITDEF